MTKKKSSKKKSGKAKSFNQKLLYPKATLEDAMKIVEAMKDKNGGNPWEPNNIAKAVGFTSKATNKFYYMTAASRDFGLTNGTRGAKKISLTEFGREVAYPQNEEKELSLKQKAFFNVEVFKKVFEYYKGSKLPEMKYLSNTLKADFNLPEASHDEFSELFKTNCEYVSIDDLPVESNPNDDSGKSGSKSVVTMAEAKNDSNLTCFVIMPFKERDERHANGFFDELLQNVITPAGQAAGFNIKTANRKGSDVIQSTIINDLLNADLVLADLTEHNPNVLFELGMRMAEDKPVVLIRAEGTGQIFDVDNMLRVQDYNPNLWPSTVKKDVPKLTEFIKASWNNRDSDQTYLKILKKENK
jgi:hypothetical protein